MKSSIRLCLGALLAALLLVACQSPTSNPGFGFKVTQIGWVTENISPTFWATTPTNNASAFFVFWVYYDGNPQLKDFAKIEVTDLTGATWTVPIDGSYIDTSKKVIGGWHRWFDQDRPHQLEIGTLTFKVKMSDGTVVTAEKDIPPPGSAVANNVVRMHTEDHTGLITNSAPMVKRATLKTALTLNSTSSTAALTFTVNDTKAYDGIIWYYDNFHDWVGSSPMLKKIPTSGQSSLPLGFRNNGLDNVVTVASSDISYDTGRSFGQISSAVAVLFDGGQYTQPANAFYYDNRSISAWTSGTVSTSVHSKDFPINRAIPSNRPQTN